MWKLKTKKRGFTLIEAMVSVGLFSIFYLIILSIYLSSLKIKTANFNRSKLSAYVEALKNNILYNASYEEMEGIYNSSLRYIGKENLNLDSIKSKNLRDILIDKPSGGEAYLKLDIRKDEIMSIGIELHYYLFTKDEIISTTVYKGNHL